MKPKKHPMRGFAIKAAVLISGLLCTLWVPYLVLGLWNRIFGGWYSVFYCYAGSTQFIDSYAPRFFVQFYRWFPVPIGVLRHDGSLGLVIASPVSEEEFLAPENAEAFERLQRRIRLVARLVGAQRISLTGILPGVVSGAGILTLPDTRPIVQRAVTAAVARVSEAQFDTPLPPVLLIGGAGHIGVPIAKALRDRGHEVHVIDPRQGDGTLPVQLHGTPALVLDCSRAGVLESYVDQMWQGMVVLNEVFPRTPRKVVEALSRKGIACWHLSGLAGSIYPPLPHGYENAVPCCAAHAAGETPEVVLTRLNPEIDALTATQPCAA